MDEDSTKRTWILAAGANGYRYNRTTGIAYWIGSWDGVQFTTVNIVPQWMDSGPDFYAAVSWSDPLLTGDQLYASLSTRKHSFNSLRFKVKKNFTSFNSTKMSLSTHPTEIGDAKPLIPKPLSALTRLSPKISLYTPPRSSANTGSPHDPTTILLCSWMNAAPKHIDHYCRTYMCLYPSARIILATTNTKEFLFQSEARRRTDVKEAVSAILAPGQANERLFVHALSNGGTKRMYAVAGAYQALTGKALPAKAFLLDSAPGIPQFRRDMHALAVPVVKWPLYLWLPYMAVSLEIVLVVFVTVNWMPKWVWKDLV